MSMLRFSAEASLYIASRHYRTREHALSLFRETNRLRPAMERPEVPPITVPGETIPVHSCLPGWQEFGGICWPPPQTEPPSGGGGHPGIPAPGEGGEPSPGPGGGQPPEKPDPHQTPKNRFRPTEGGKCFADEMRGNKAIFVPKGKYTRLPGDIWFCCDPKPPKECIQCQGVGIDDGACTNGWLPLG
jgi:hypothetical protein